MKQRTAIIIGAGPAGLTAAYELATKTDIKPIIFEASNEIGGIARTVNYKGNRIDIGGHRFFSKSDRVMDWWREIMPLQGKPTLEEQDLSIPESMAVSLEKDGVDPETTSLVMLIRKRLSRIFFLRSFFDYPITLNGNTISNLGFWRMTKIGVSYVKIRLFPVKEEKSLEDFFINRFGRELYLTFFKDYTEKLWGISCKDIAPDWGSQRIKGLSISKAIKHALTSSRRKDASVSQKKVETSLIEQFLYPKLGPGQMWEEVARKVVAQGGELHMNSVASGFVLIDGKVSVVKIDNLESGKEELHTSDYVFSTMPIKDLIAGFGDGAPKQIREVASGLMYRDFITVGLLLKKLRIKNNTPYPTPDNRVPDNWIYIQERDVKVGRIQVFNNWSPYLVKDPGTVWIGLEYFCNEGDELWSMSDEEFAKFSVGEVEHIGIIAADDVLDSTVIRVPKTYPAYFGTYGRLNEVKEYLDGLENLFLIGRNGMHRYNNQDHSMLTAMYAVENIINGRKDKDNIWGVNAEDEYHESK